MDVRPTLLPYNLYHLKHSLHMDEGHQLNLHMKYVSGLLNIVPSYFSQKVSYVLENCNMVMKIVINIEVILGFVIMKMSIFKSAFP